MGVAVDVETERNVMFGCRVMRGKVEAAGDFHARVNIIDAGNRKPFLIGQWSAVEDKAWELAPVTPRQGDKRGMGSAGSEWVRVDGRIGICECEKNKGGLELRRQTLVKSLNSTKIRR